MTINNSQHDEDNEPTDPDEYPIIRYLFLLGCTVFVLVYLFTSLVTFLIARLFHSSS